MYLSCVIFFVFLRKNFTAELKKDTQYPSAKGTSVVYKLSFSQKSFYLKNVDYEFGLLVDGAPSQSKYVALAPESGPLMSARFPVGTSSRLAWVKSTPLTD